MRSEDTLLNGLSIADPSGIGCIPSILLLSTVLFLQTLFHSLLFYLFKKSFYSSHQTLFFSISPSIAFQPRQQNFAHALNQGSHNLSLDASSHLYKRVYPSVCPCIRPLTFRKYRRKRGFEPVLLYWSPAKRISLPDRACITFLLVSWSDGPCVHNPRIKLSMDQALLGELGIYEHF